MWSIVCFWLAVESLCISTVQAQAVLSGTVKDAQTHQPLYPATIQNRTRGLYALTNPDGSFALLAHPGDTIWIAFLGYSTDTLIMQSLMDRHPINIWLNPTAHQLQMVTVHGGLNPYQLDSIERRKLFAPYLSRAKQSLAGNYTPSGFGIVLSPFTYFSRKQRNLRRFRKMFLAYEQQQRNQYYTTIRAQQVAAKYNPTRISQITGLRGDSLQLFIHTMPVDTNFILQAPQDAVDEYIRQRYERFIHPENASTPNKKM